MIRRSLAAGLVLGCVWIAAVSLLPLLFLHKIEKKYSFHLLGHKTFSLLNPEIKIKDAAFIWDKKVELVRGDLDLSVDGWRWLSSRVWAIDLRGDGSHLRFLGDWLRKTGVGDIHAEKLRLQLDFADHEIQDIRLVELVSPTYQFKIAARPVKT